MIKKKYPANKPELKKLLNCRSLKQQQFSQMCQANEGKKQKEMYTLLVPTGTLVVSFRFQARHATLFPTRR